MKKQTLVIHPEDPSTDFLIEIYRDRGFTEIRQDFHPQKLEELILKHQRILFLGHGFHHGLLHFYQTIIDQRFAPILQNKELVGIWCFAKSFFDQHQLKGFYTDMFISEFPEAQVMGVQATESEIEESNREFARAVRKNLFHPNCHQRILNDYGKLTTAVARYNQERLCFRGMDGRTIATDGPSIPQLSSLLKMLNLDFCLHRLLQ